MMKTTIEFNLPEDQEEMRLAMNGAKYRQALSEFDEHLRARIKYGQISEEEGLILQDIRSKLYEIMSDNGVGL